VQTGPKSIEWAAGLFEGEGCLSYLSTTNIWEISVEMTDKDSVWSFYEALGCVGNMTGRRRASRPHYKPTYRWRTCKRDLIFDIVMTFYPHLHERRQDKCKEFIAWYLSK